MFSVTWWAVLAARQSLYVQILERGVAKTSLSRFVPVWFSQAAVGRALRPVRPVVPILCDKKVSNGKHITSNTQKIDLKQIELKERFSGGRKT